MYSADKGTPMVRLALLSPVIDFQIDKTQIKRILIEIYLQYTSPERLTGELICPANDIYAFAMLAWQLLDDADNQAYMPHLQLVHQVLENDWRPDIVSDVPDEYDSMLQRAWATDPFQRPSSLEIRSSLTVMLIGLKKSLTGS